MRLRQSRDLMYNDVCMHDTCSLCMMMAVVYACMTPAVYAWWWLRSMHDDGCGLCMHDTCSLCMMMAVVYACMTPAVYAWWWLRSMHAWHLQSMHDDGCGLCMHDTCSLCMMMAAVYACMMAVVYACMMAVVFLHWFCLCSILPIKWLTMHVYIAPSEMVQWFRKIPT